MSLAETNTVGVAKKQYQYKVKSYMNLFFSMAGAQVMAILFSLGGISSSGMGSGRVMLSISGYSSDIIIVFTCIWAFIVALTLTTREYRDVDFAFVSNRQSSSLANMGFLVTAGVVGGITAMLGGVFLRVLIYFSLGGTNIVGGYFFPAPQELLFGMTVAALYLLLVSAAGYFSGTLVQLSKAFYVILPALFIGTLMLDGRNPQRHLILDGMNFFLHETSFVLLAAKIILIAGVLFASTVVLANKLEVRK